MLAARRQLGPLRNRPNSTNSSKSASVTMSPARMMRSSRTTERVTGWTASAAAARAAAVVSSSGKTVGTMNW